MRRFESHMIGIDDGDEVLFSDFEHGGQMWAGEGPRALRHSVSFSGAFLAPPSVQVSLSMWDISNAATTRMDIRAEDITENGFTIVFRTWGDTKIARARAAWRAIGPVEHPENWMLY